MRAKAESKVEGNDFVQITFSLKENNNLIEWKDEGKEFSYKNEMYDVAKTIVHNDSVTYYCLHDENEKTLINNFDKLVKNNLDGNGKKKNYTIKELSKYNLNHFKEACLLFNKIEFTSLIPDFYKSIPEEIQSPPPKYAC